MTRYQGEFGVPFLYSTNGEEIWFHDVRHALNRSRRVAAFHTLKALARDARTETLKQNSPSSRAIPASGWLRPYQVEANTAIEQAIARRNARCW